jgi:hypothetical protein
MALFSLVMGAIILTPHVQMAYFSLWAYAGYSAYRLVAFLRAERRMPWKASLGALCAVLVALAISAVQFYPSYDYVKNYSPRAGEGRGFDYAASWSLHPEELLSEIVPEFSGVADTQTNSYWGRNAFKDNSEYGGLIVLLLAVYTVLATSFKDRWVFLVLGLGAAAYALGAHTPVFTLFYYVVPNVKQLRAPSMIMFVYVFSIILCAGAALDSFLNRSGPGPRAAWQRRWFWIAAAVLGACALLLSLAPTAVLHAYQSLVYPELSAEKAAIFQRHQDTIVLGAWGAALLAAALAYLMSRIAAGAWRWPLLGLFVLVLVDTLRMDQRFVSVVDLNRFFPPEPVVDFLKRQREPTRVLAPPGGFRTNYFALQGIQEMDGYHGNQLRSYNDFLGGSHQPRLYSKPALDLAGVDYLIFRRGANLESDPDLPQFEKVFDEAGVVAFRNRDALPRARLVSRWEECPAGDTLCERMFDPGFDYRSVALVEAPLPFESRPEGTPVGSAEIESYELNRVGIRVQALDSSLLVLSDNYYPAWEATLNASPVPVIRANCTFRGVVVPPGESLVLFEYHSPRLVLGAWVSLAATLSCLAVVAASFRRRADGSPS